MDKQQALQIWERLFGDKEVAYDFASHPMKKEDFQNKQSHYGWDIDVKKPFLSRMDNYLPCSLNTIGFRQGKPTFKVGNNLFEVRKGKVYGTFSIYDITDRNHPINCDPTAENQDPEYNKARFHSIAVSYHPERMVDPRVRVSTSSVLENALNSYADENGGPIYEEDDLFDTEETPVEEESLEEPAVEEKEPETVEEPAVEEPEEQPEEQPENEVVSEDTQEVVEETVVEEVAAEEPIVEQVSLEETEEEVTEEPAPEVIPEYVEEAVTEEVTSEPEMVEEAVEEETEPVAEPAEEERQEVFEDESFSEEEETVLETANEVSQPEMEEEPVVEEKPVEEENNGLLETIEELKKQIDQNNEEISSLNSKLASVASEKEALESQNVALNEEKERLLLEKEQIHQESESLKQQIEEQNAQNNSNLQNILEANNALKERITVLTTEAEQNQSKIKDLNEEKDTLTYELEMNKEANEELSKQLNEAQNQVVEKANDQSEAINSLAAQLEEEKQKTEQLQSQIASLENQGQNNLSIKDDEIVSLRNELSALNNEKIGLTNEKENLAREKNSLEQQLAESKAHEQEIQKKLEYLAFEDEKLRASYNQLDAQSEMIDDQLAVLNEENAKLLKKEEENKLQLEELNKKCENLTMELDRANVAASEGDGAKEALRKAQSERDVAIEDKKRSEARASALNEKLISLQDEMNEKETRYTQEKADTAAEVKQKTETIEALQKERDASIRKILFINSGGDENSYDIFQSYLEANFMEFNPGNIKSVLIAHPEWRKRDNNAVGEIRGEAKMIESESVSYLANSNERKEKARSFYADIFGEEKIEVSDFAGRYIRLNDYANKESEYGWDYALIDPEESEIKDNVFIANLKSIKDYKFNKVFESNGHSYQTIKEQGKYKISSADYISDPYDFTEALRVSRNNMKKTSPLLYLFVKAVGINTSEPDQESLMELFDILDRTVKRCCPLSFVEMKTVVGTGKGNYAFITFDGSVEDSYREVLDYAMLLNSYRREFRKQERLNAVIVLNEVEVAFSKRHLDYDALLTETRDDELRALRYEFNMAVINSIIKRTIHIGPRILDKLPLDQNLLKPSQIGQGNFAKMYRLDKEFKIYNFVYSLSIKEEDNA
jgi:hypothetical protein